MHSAGLAIMIALLLTGCGESGKQAAGTTPTKPASNAASSATPAPPAADAKEREAAPPKLPPSEPYGTPTN